MRILIACNNDTISEYLTNAGHEVKSLYANDLSMQTIKQFPCDLIIYFSTVEAVIPHQKAIASIHEAGIRVIFVAPPEDPLIYYVAALGNVDILLYPVSREALLDKIMNPSSSTEIAKLVYECKHLSNKTTETTETGTKNNEYVNNKEEDKQSFLKRIRDIKRINVNIPISMSMPSFKFAPAKAKRQYSRVITVISPVSAGKTFITVNLGAYLTQIGYSVAIIDADFKQLSIANWLNIRGNGLYDALGNIDSCLEYAFQPNLLPGLYVFTASNESNDREQVSNIKSLDLLLKELESIVDVILVDTAQEPPVSLINDSTLVVLVADMDTNHLRQIKNYLHKETILDGDLALLVNKAIKGKLMSQEDVEDMLDLPVSGMINYKPLEVYESINEGIPTCMFVQEIEKGLDKFWNGITIHQ